MMNPPLHSYTHFNWFELLEIGLFVLLVLFIAIFLVRYFILTPTLTTGMKEKITQGKTQYWKEIPEFLLLTLSLPLHLLWEIAQFPLYTVWHEGDWSYILYGLAHCALGDLLILLNVFWLVSLLNRSRYWVFSPSLMSNIVLFTLLGLTYTIFSEIINTRVNSTWGYTELMPIVPVIEIGAMPFLQWLLISPILIWMMQLMKPTQNI